MAQTLSVPQVFAEEAAKPADTPAVAKSAPALATWLEANRSASGAFPRHLTFLRRMPDKKTPPVFLAVDKTVFDALSYLRVANNANADWDFKLNKERVANLDPFDAVLQITHADTLVLAPEKGDWTIWRKVGGNRSAVFSGKGPASVTPQAIATWMFEVFNWDGVVLAQEGDYLLVGSLAKTLAEPQIQALAVGDSQDKLLLAAAERKGAGLLSLSEAKGGNGVFDIVLLGKGVTKLAPGTKLIMEKKK